MQHRGFRAYLKPILCKIRAYITFRQMICTDSRAHHSAFFENRALEAAKGAAFAEIPRFCNFIIIIRGFSLMAG